LAAEGGFFVFRAGRFEEFVGFGRVGDFEDARGSAAARATGAVGVIDVDVIGAQELRDVGQGAGVIGEIEAKDFGFGHGEVQFCEDIARCGWVFGDDAEDAVFLGIDQGHGDDVDLGRGERAGDLGENAGFVDEEDGELSFGSDGWHGDSKVKS